jgi:hypothetical protein
MVLGQLGNGTLPTPTPRAQAAFLRDSLGGEPLPRTPAGGGSLRSLPSLRQPAPPAGGTGGISSRSQTLAPRCLCLPELGRPCLWLTVERNHGPFTPVLLAQADIHRDIRHPAANGKDEVGIPLPVANRRSGLMAGKKPNIATEVSAQCRVRNAASCHRPINHLTC